MTDEERIRAWDQIVEAHAQAVLQSALTLKSTAIAAACMLSIKTSFSLDTAIAVAERAVIELKDIQAKKGPGRQ